MASQDGTLPVPAEQAVPVANTSAEEGRPVAPVTGPSLDWLQVSATGRLSALVETGDGLRAREFKALVFGHHEAGVGASLTQAHLAAGFGVTDTLAVGLAVPVALAPMKVGSVGLEGRLTLLRQAQGAPVDFGGSVWVDLPAVASNEVSVTSRLGVGRAFGGLVRVGLEGGVAAGLSTGARAVSLAASASTLGDGVRGEFDVRGLWSPSTGAVAAEVLVGARYPLLRHQLELTTLLGAGQGEVTNGASWRVLVGVAWTPGRVSARALELPTVDEEVPSVMVGCVSDAAVGEIVVDEVGFDATVHFALNLAVVESSERAAVIRVAELLASNPEAKVQVHGHADQTGPAAFNERLALARAEAVVMALVEQGVDARRLVAVGDGTRAPLSDDDVSGRPLNRYVDFVVTR